MKRLLLKICIKFLLALFSVKLCTAVEDKFEIMLKDNSYQIGRENTEWLVAIFHVPYGVSLLDDIKYEYLCPGVLIHPQAVSALSYCWSKPSQTSDAVVRSYNWRIKNITGEALYKQRNVREIINYPSYAPNLSAASHINFLVLDEPFKIIPDFPINYIRFENYEKDRRLFRNECFAFHVAGTISEGLSMQKILTYPSNEASCCMNWLPSLNETVDFASSLDKCMSKLTDMDCFEYLDLDESTELADMGSPVFCQHEGSSVHQNLYYFRGFVSDTLNNEFLIANIQKRKNWIRNELEQLFI